MEESDVDGGPDGDRPRSADALGDLDEITADLNLWEGHLDLVTARVRRRQVTIWSRRAEAAVARVLGSAPGRRSHERPGVHRPGEVIQ